MSDELLEDFDRILTVKEMRDELPDDRRSPVIQDLMREYVEANQEYIEQYEAFVEGNFRAGATANAGTSQEG